MVDQLLRHTRVNIITHFTQLTGHYHCSWVGVRGQYIAFAAETRQKRKEKDHQIGHLFGWKEGRALNKFVLVELVVDNQVRTLVPPRLRTSVSITIG